MVRRTRRYNKRGGSGIPPLQKYGFQNGASSPQQNAIRNQEQAARAQNELNNKHGGGRRRTRKRKGGYQYKGGNNNGRIVVPQSENAPPAAGPVDGNSLAVHGAGNLTQNKENATTDDYNGSPTVKTVAGGARRRGRKSRRKSRKSKRKNGKKKSRRRSKRKSKRKFVVGGKRRRTSGKGGYMTQLWGCFS